MRRLALIGLAAPLALGACAAEPFGGEEAISARVQRDLGAGPIPARDAAARVREILAAPLGAESAV
jgi:hypothetical protein